MGKMTLAAARVNAGYTQKQAAEKLGVSTTTICAWETGKSVPNIKHIDPLCTLYGRTYDEINFLPNNPL